MAGGKLKGLVARWNLVDHPLWCFSAQQDSIKKANMKRENKAYSFKEQIIELELKEVGMRRPQASPLGHPDLWHIPLTSPLSPGPPVTFLICSFSVAFSTRNSRKRDFLSAVSSSCIFSAKWCNLTPCPSPHPTPGWPGPVCPPTVGTGPGTV